MGGGFGWIAGLVFGEFCCDGWKGLGIVNGVSGASRFTKGGSGALEYLRQCMDNVFYNRQCVMFPSNKSWNPDREILHCSNGGGTVITIIK